MRKGLTRMAAFTVMLGTLMFGTNVNAQKIKVDAKNFPDSEMRNAVEAMFRDEDGTTWINNTMYVETDKVEFLSLFSDGDDDNPFNIKDIKGLELFTDLTSLTIAFNGNDLTISNSKLEELNVTTDSDITVNSPSLKKLVIDTNKTINKADVSGVPSVTECSVAFGNNAKNVSVIGLEKLTKLNNLSLGAESYENFDVDKLPALSYLSLDGLKSSSFNIGNEKLEIVSFGSVNIDSLDLTACTNLKGIYASPMAHIVKNISMPDSIVTLFLSDCSLESIDVSKCKNLKTARLDGNKLSGIDVSKNSKLELLDVGGNSKIKKIDVSKNKKLKFVNALDTNVSKIKTPNNKNLAMAFSVKRGKTIKTSNYFGKGYTMDVSKKAKKKSPMELYDFLPFYKISDCKINFASNMVKYNKKKGTITLSKKAKKGKVSYCCYMKKGKTIRKIYICAK